MDTFLKAIAGILIALVVCIVLAKQGKDISALLTIGACCIVATAAVSYLQPVVQFFTRLKTLGGLNTDMVGVMLKAVGIALLGEITGHICSDAGNAALGKTLQILASAVILWMSLPLFISLIELIEKILESI